MNGNLNVLRRKGKTCRKETHGKFNKAKSIRKRPKSAYSRAEQVAMR